jgi:hypothetical protein
MLKISIPKPCNKDWDAMLPDGRGKHCLSCAKTVVDFTNMNDDEVKLFFLNKKEEHICGRFTNSQITNIRIEFPADLFQISMPIWKRFLAACLIVFSTTLFSCESNIKADKSVQLDKPMTPPVDSLQHILGDTTIDVRPIDTTVAKQIYTCPATMGLISTPVIPETTKGEMEIILPKDTVKKQAATIQTVIKKEVMLTGDVELIDTDQLKKTKTVARKDSSDCNSAGYQ